MPIPKPQKDEEQKEFFNRCMSDKTMNKEFPDNKQRMAVCGTAWGDKGKKMKNEFQSLNFKINLKSEIRYIDDNEYLVAPVVALVEGVHHGSGGEVFYPAEEIGKFIAAWNGRPVTLGHPKISDSIPVSANDPVIIEEYLIGRFYNAEFKDGKLKGEVWFDVKKTNILAPEILQAIRDGKRIEVSTGLWTDGDGKSGEWNGEKYNETVYNFRPDHLAIIIDGEGACNWIDGCGIRDNSSGENMDIIRNLKRLGYKINEISHSKIWREIQSMLDGDSGSLTKSGYKFVRDIFDNYYIFEMSENGTPMRLFKQFYSINKDDKVVLDGEPIEVVEKIEFLALDNKGGISMKNDLKKVQALVDNEKLPFTDADIKWLEEMDSERFDNLYTLNECKCSEQEVKALEEANKKIDELTQANTSMNEQLKKKGEKLDINAAVQKVVKEMSFEELLANAKPGFREAIEDGMKTNAEKRENLVKAIIANESNKFTEEQLKAMKTDILENIASFIKVPIDYSGRGSVVQNKTTLKPNERHPDGNGVPDVVDWTKTVNK